MSRAAVDKWSALAGDRRKNFHEPSGRREKLIN